MGLQPVFLGQEGQEGREALGTAIGMMMISALEGDERNKQPPLWGQVRFRAFRDFLGTLQELLPGCWRKTKCGHWTRPSGQMGSSSMEQYPEYGSH